MTRFIPIAAGLLAAAITAAPALAEPARVADWPTFLIARPGALAVPPPPDAAETASELAELRRNAVWRAPDLAVRLRPWQAGGPTHRWNDIAMTELVAHHSLANASSRALSLLHVALHDATVAVHAARAMHARPAPSVQDSTLALAGAPVPSGSSYPSETAAVGAAASAILAALMPDRAALFARIAAESVAMRQHAGLEFPSDAAAGRAIGDAVARLALARAQDDGFARAFSGTIPTGPGRWQGTTMFAPMAGTWRAWLLPANDALRPPPPPAHDSPETAAQLAELKAYPRTPKTNADAIFWEVYGGARVFQFWNAELSRRVLEYGLADDPPRVAAAYAALNVAFYDSFIACFDAKYAYWYARPAQLDTSLRTVVPTPAHPSYPSAHSCLSTASATVLQALFPTDTEALHALARQASEARVAAGIHYRFDCEAGEEIGRRAAALALAKMAPAMR
jgi:membrane-associated phospholipid phosphatase